MSVFNSLGSNYTARMVWRSLLPAKHSANHQLEKMLRSYYAVSSCLLTFRGREALTVVLRSLKLPAGSKVAINGFTCYVVYEAVVAAGLTPHFVDLTPQQLNFGVDELRVALRRHKDIRAVIVQNTFGIPADIAGIQKICKAAGVLIVEDLAHAIGLRYQTGQEAGTVGAATVLSFGQNKSIDAAAGGAALLHEGNLRAATLPQASFWARLTAYVYPLNTWCIRQTHRAGLGKVLLKLYKAVRIIPDPTDDHAGNVRALPAHQANLALQSFNDLPAIIKHRQKIAALYHATLPAAVQYSYHKNAVYVRFPITVQDRAGLTAYLKRRGIYLGTPWYDAIAAPKRHMSSVKYAPGSCPNGEQATATIVNLPTHRNIDEPTARRIVKEVQAWLELSSSR